MRIQKRSKRATETLIVLYEEETGFCIVFNLAIHNNAYGHVKSQELPDWVDSKITGTNPVTLKRDAA